MNYVNRNILKTGIAKKNIVYVKGLVEKYFAREKA